MQLTHTDKPLTVAIALLLLAFVVAYILPLGARPLAAPDETRYAEIPREMLVSGDWVVPRLVGLRYFEKPVFGYWLNAISIKIFGENNFAVRFTSALSMGLSAWFVWLLVLRSGYSRELAFVSAAIYLSFLEVLALGVIAILDTPFAMLLTGGTVLFYLGTHFVSQSQQRRYLIGSGVIFGLAFMTKGFLAFALPVIVWLPYIFITRQFKIIGLSLWTIAAALVTVAPWAIAIHLQEPDYWHYFIWEEHIRRFSSPDAQHAAPAYYYILLLPILAFPWSSLIPAVIAGHRLVRHNRDFSWFLILWAVMPLIFFSISKGKLITYILPCFAPMAILMASGLINYLQAKKTRWVAFGIILNVVILFIFLAYLFYHDIIDGTKAFYQEIEFDNLLFLLFSLLVAIVVALLTLFFKSTHMRIICIMCSSALLLPAFGIALPRDVLEAKSPSYVIDHVKEGIGHDAILVSDANAVRAVAWAFKRADILMLYKGELKYGLDYPEHADRYIGEKGLGKLLNKQNNGEIQNDIAVFCESPCPDRLTQILGPHATEMSNGEYSVWVVRANKN